MSDHTLSTANQSSVKHISEEGADSGSQETSPVVNQGEETSIQDCPAVSNKEAEPNTLIHPAEGHSGISIPAQGHNSGVDIGWNFDGMEDKNPFSGMSEEHLNKLDEVLSSVNVQELLQQTNPELNLLNLDGTEQLPGAAGSSARRDSSDSLPESIVSVVFSDHGYCLNPEKAGKVKPFIPQTVSKSPNVLVTVEPSSDDVTCEGFPTALNMSTDSPSDSDAKTESPHSSPRKSGRAHTKSKYLDEEWITSSPSKGRGRGRGAASPVVTPFGLSDVSFRASSRISDQKQRDLAEKIMLANRQAMQAEKTSTEDTDMNVGKSPQKSKSKGSGKRSPGRSSMEDKDSDKDGGDDLEEEGEEENDSEEEDVESEEEEVEDKSTKKGKGKVDKKKKKGGKYEEDSDFEDETGGKNVKKTKGKKKGRNDASDTETVVAKGKKGKKKKVVKGKKKGKEKVGKKLKGKAVKADEETQDSDESDEESESKSEVKEKSPKKANKKLTKKERLKKLKEAKAAKRAKLLEKKKNKKKDKKTGKVEATEKASPAKTKVLPKGKVVGVKKKLEESETTDASPKGKKTKTAEQKSPKAAEKRKASPARAAKLKGTVASPAKKPKLTRQQLAKQSKTEIQDSDDDKPLASMKGDNKESKSSSTTEKIGSPVRGEMNIFANLSVGLGSDTITSESFKVKTEVMSVETLKVDTQDKNVEVKEIVNKESTHDSGSEKKEMVDNSSTLKSVGKKTQNKEADKTVDVVSPISSNEIDEDANKNKELVESKKRQDSEDNKSHHHHHHHRHRTHSKDSNNEEKTESGSQSQRHESRDRKDSQSHRESSERRHSRDRRESHSSDKDRKSSKSTRDKDRHSRKSSDSSEKDRRDSVKGRRESSSDTKSDSKKLSGMKDPRESTSTVSSSSNTKVTKGNVGPKKIGKDGKGKIKKSKKNDEMTVDSSMIDLFKPDNLPVVVKEESEAKTASVNDEIKEKSEEKERVSKVKFLDCSDSSSKETGISDEKALVGPEVIKMENVKTSSRDTETERDVKNEVSVEAMDIDDNSESVNKNSKEENNAMEIDVDLKLEDKNDSPENKTDDLNEKCEDNESDKKVGVSESDRDVIDSDKKETLNVKDEVKKELVDTAPEKAVVDDTKEVKKVVATDVKKETNKPKKPLRMSDFFSERRLKINDPKPRQKVVKEVAVSEQTTTDNTSGRQRRNKNVAFAEILKKEKLGSDDEEHSDSEFEDDENDEDFEDPDQLYCICRQPHNQRFMICCDKCEEWFHGNCVGISKSRGAEMEKNNEEYVCPNCVSKEGAIQDGSVVSTTQSPEHPNKKSQSTGKSKVNEKSVAEDSKSIKPDSTVDKDATIVKSKQETSRSKTTKSQGEANPKSLSVGSQSSKSKKELKSTHKTSITKGQVTPKSEEKSKDKDGGSTKKGDLTEKRKRVIQMVKEEVEGKDKPKQPYNKCFTCNTRPPRRDSLYCSEECRQKHSKHNVAPGILKVTVIKDIKKSKERHIAVVDKSTGRTLTGEKAPTESELKTWLQDNPTYEILKSHNKMEAKPLGLSSSDKKREEKDSSKSSKSEKSAKSEKDKGPEPIRLNVRKGLRDALAARADAADDIMLSNSEIKGLALSIEEELFKYFKDTDSKYKAKYRSLLFNIRDQKNKGLFRKILNRKIRASKLVRMSADELANKELAQWREQETKHTIEMIKQIETKQLNEPVHVMKKTHKGEEEVADEEGEDLSALANEPKKPQETPKLEQNQTEEGDDELDTTDTHGQHLFDANCKICTGKQVPTLETTPTKSKASSSDTNLAIEKELTKSQHDLKADEVVKEVLKAIQRAKEDERKEQQRSSVTVRSPDSALSSGLDKNVKFTPIGPMLWKGFIYMQDVSKFVTTAYRVTGPAEHLVIPDTITLCGRISPEHVWDYLNKVKQSATRDICVIRFIPGINEEKVAYINLYSYLNSRSRCGVVEHRAKNIKDFYIVPLASHSKIPSVLKPFDGPGLEENRCHMLLGVIIRNKVKGSTSSSSGLSKSSHSHRSRHSKSQPLKSALKPATKHDAQKKEGSSRDETPDKSSESSTPRTSSSSSTPQTSSSTEKRSISFDPIVKEYSHVTEQEMAIEPVGDDPLDLNAPYDPEKEVLKEAAKPRKEEPQQDTVTKMIDKIAQSKNPAEATAAMVAALATTSKLGNQRKLLMELTKKVDEQKRLLEQKRISSKFGQSPSGSSPGSSKISSTSSLGISSKDPRLRNQQVAQQVVDTAADAQDLDLRVKPGMTAPSGASSVPASKTSVLPPSISATALENSVSILSSLTSDIASNVASPVKVSSTQSSDSSFSKAITSHSAASTSVLTKDSESDKTNRSDVSEPVKPKGFYVDHAHAKDKTKVDINSGIVVTDSVQKKTTESIRKADLKSKSDKISDSKDKNNSEDHSEKKKGAQHDIVTQLMAEVSGKSTDMAVKTQPDSKEDKDPDPGKEPQQGTSKASVPNVTELLKNLGSDKSDSGKKSSIQLPSALMSLFSKLPGSVEDPQEEKLTQIPGLFTSETEGTEDTDLRKSGDKKQGSVVPGLGDVASDGKQDSLTDENLSKSFMGFDYDSDSSGGSFEGFDDDGTKKLSPRKRKLVQKSARELSPKTNIFGDVDERPAADIDLRAGNDVDLRQDSKLDVKDIDDRVHMALAPSMDRPRPPGEGPRPSIPPHSGLGLPFMPSDQPPPPGEDWSHPTTTQMAVGIPNMHPTSVEWSHAPLPESQPPLPAEPPMPKPPEPPMKKKKWEDFNQFDEGSDNETDGKGQSKNSRKKKKKKAKKDKKGGSVTSDERLQQIILEIAKNEPKKSQPVAPVVPPPGMPFVPRPQGMMPMVSMGVPPPPVPCAMPPSCPPIPGTMPLPTSGWMGDGVMGPGLNSQSALQPPPIPPHRQPGVIPNPQLQGSHMELTPPGISHVGPSHPKFSNKPPSLLDLPTLPPPSKLIANKTDVVNASPIIETKTSSENVREVSESIFVPPEPETDDQVTEVSSFSCSSDRTNVDERAPDRDRDERRRRDRHRSRSGDRSRRSRSGDRNRRSHSGDRETDHHRGRSRDYDRRRYDDRDRDGRHYGRERDRWHRRR